MKQRQDEEEMGEASKSVSIIQYGRSLLLLSRSSSWRPNPFLIGISSQPTSYKCTLPGSLAPYSVRIVMYCTSGSRPANLSLVIATLGEVGKLGTLYLSSGSYYGGVYLLDTSHPNQWMKRPLQQAGTHPSCILPFTSSSDLLFLSLLSLLSSFSSSSFSSSLFFFSHRTSSFTKPAKWVTVKLTRRPSTPSAHLR